MSTKLHSHVAQVAKQMADAAAKKVAKQIAAKKALEMQKQKAAQKGTTSKSAASDKMSSKGKSRLKNDEGYRSKVYKDTEGHLTVGWGHKLTSTDKQTYNKVGESVPKQKLIDWFTSDLAKAEVGAKRVVGDVIWNKLNQTRRDILINMVFNMGEAGVGKFKKMIEALGKSDYNEAAEQMKNSKWYKQVGKRAERLINYMQKGTYSAKMYGEENNLEYMDYMDDMDDMNYIDDNELDYVGGGNNYDLNEGNSYYVGHHNDYVRYHEKDGYLDYSDMPYLAIFIGVLMMIGVVCCVLFFIIGFGVGWVTRIYKSREKRLNVQCNDDNV